MEEEEDMVHILKTKTLENTSMISEHGAKNILVCCQLGEKMNRADNKKKIVRNIWEQFKDNFGRNWMTVHKSIIILNPNLHNEEND